MTMCKVCNVIKQVDIKDRNAIIKSLPDQDITNEDLAIILTNNGFPVSEASIRRHKKGNHVNSK